MPTISKLTQTLNGKTDVALLNGTKAWEKVQSGNTYGWLGYLDVFDSVPKDFFQTTTKITGTKWNIGFLKFGAKFGNIAKIRDLDGQSDRNIDYVKLGKNSDVDLISTRIKHIDGQSGGNKHDVSLGSASTDSVNLQAKVNVVKTGTGFVKFIVTDGKDVVKIGAGGAGSIVTNDGNDRVTTTTKWVRDIYTGDGKDVVVIGNGNAGQVDTGKGADKIIAKGWVSQIRADDGDDVVRIGNGGADYVRTGDDNDTITLGNGYVQIVNAGEGHDVVTMGKGGASVVKLGGGDDVLTAKMFSTPQNGVRVQGNSGSDTINFEKFNVGVTFTLDSNGVWQNPGAAGGSLYATGKGFYSETSIENIGGTNLKDFLTGDNGSNVIGGRQGADTIEGKGGKDLLDVGNDSGTTDILIYTKVTDSGVGAANRDVISQFDISFDKIDLSAIDANTSTGADDAFLFSVTPNAANSVWVEVSGSTEFLKGDVDGDGTADFEIELLNVSGLSAIDLFL